MTSRGAEKMKQDTIGVDISKDTLDVHPMAGGANRRFTNDKTGHRALIAWIGGDVARVVFEPTGPYHRAFERALAKAGLPLVKVNPRQARRFAEATGKLAKTDRLDAALLARMGEASEMPFRCGGALLAIEPRPAREPRLSPNSRSSISPAKRWLRIAPPPKTAPKSGRSRC
jgi:transposase